MFLRVFTPQTPLKSFNNFRYSKGTFFGADSFKQNGFLKLQFSAYCRCLCLCFSIMVWICCLASHSLWQLRYWKFISVFRTADNNNTEILIGKEIKLKFSDRHNRMSWQFWTCWLNWANNSSRKRVFRSFDYKNCRICYSTDNLNAG